MRRVLFDRLAFDENGERGDFRGVPVIVFDTGFDETIEVMLSPVH